MEQARWLEELDQAEWMRVGEPAELPIDPADVTLVFEYHTNRTDSRPAITAL
jgi:hypothetical protein